MLLLWKFDFKIIHKLGKNYFGANFLSRAALVYDQSNLNDQFPDAKLFKLEGDTEWA